jgi:hypothetical protein
MLNYGVSSTHFLPVASNTSIGKVKKKIVMNLQLGSNKPTKAIMHTPSENMICRLTIMISLVLPTTNYLMKV